MSTFFAFRRFRCFRFPFFVEFFFFLRFPFFLSLSLCLSEGVMLRSKNGYYWNATRVGLTCQRGGKFVCFVVFHLFSWRFVVVVVVVVVVVAVRCLGFISPRFSFLFFCWFFFFKKFLSFFLSRSRSTAGETFDAVAALSIDAADVLTWNNQTDAASAPSQNSSHGDINAPNDDQRKSSFQKINDRPDVRVPSHRRRQLLSISKGRPRLSSVTQIQHRFIQRSSGSKKKPKVFFFVSIFPPQFLGWWERSC